jgi:hypothetical protein
MTGVATRKQGRSRYGAKAGSTGPAVAAAS